MNGVGFNYRVVVTIDSVSDERLSVEVKKPKEISDKDLGLFDVRLAVVDILLPLTSKDLESDHVVVAAFYNSPLDRDPGFGGVDIIRKDSPGGSGTLFA